MAIRAHEGAPPAVALPDEAPQQLWDAPGASCHRRAGLHAEALLLEVREVVAHRPRVDQRRVARGQRVAEQRLRPTQVLVLGLRDGQPHVVLARGRGRHPAATRVLYVRLTLPGRGGIARHAVATV